MYCTGVRKYTGSSIVCSLNVNISYVFYLFYGRLFNLPYVMTSYVRPNIPYIPLSTHGNIWYIHKSSRSRLVPKSPCPRARPAAASSWYVCQYQEEMHAVGRRNSLHLHHSSPAHGLSMCSLFWSIYIHQLVIVFVLFVSQAKAQVTVMRLLAFLSAMYI